MPGFHGYNWIMLGYLITTQIKQLNLVWHGVN